MHEITGRTRIFAVLADPIDHVRAPPSINTLAAARRYDGVMVPVQVAAADLPTVVAGLRAVGNLGGFIVTVPHKTAIAPLLDTLSDAARLVGAVNVVRREPNGQLAGTILDGEGFVAGLRAAGYEPRQQSVYLAGAGGAAAAIAFALAQAGVSRLTLANRTPERGAALLARLRHHCPDLTLTLGTRDPSGHDIVVNATSQGLRADDGLPMDVAGLASSQIVADIIMQPEITALMAAAAARGCRVHPGFPMLRCQLDLMADWMGMRSAAGVS